MSGTTKVAELPARVERGNPAGQHFGIGGVWARAETREVSGWGVYCYYFLTAITFYYFLLRRITPSVFCSCVDALNTRSRVLPLSPTGSHCLPLSPAVSRCLPLSPAVSRCLPLSPTVSRCLPLSPAVSYCFPLHTTRLSFLPDHHPEARPAWVDFSKAKVCGEGAPCTTTTKQDADQVSGWGVYCQASVDFLLLDVAPSASCSCLDAPNTHPAATSKLPLSPTLYSPSKFTPQPSSSEIRGGPRVPRARGGLEEHCGSVVACHAARARAVPSTPRRNVRWTTTQPTHPLTNPPTTHHTPHTTRHIPHTTYHILTAHYRPLPTLPTLPTLGTR